MGYYTFGGGAAEVAVDATGSVLGGVTYEVYSKATGGTRVTDLQDLTGAPLPGMVSSATPENAETPEGVGRIAFKAPDVYPVLYLDAGYGLRWAIMAREVWGQVGTAIDRADEAYTSLGTVHSDYQAMSDQVEQMRQTVENSAGLYGFDITGLSPQYVGQLSADPFRVVQSFEKDTLTGQYYGAQTNANDDTTIIRFTPDGRIIDAATLVKAGHGSSIAVERVGAEVYIWSWWTTPVSGAGFPFRWKYTAGATVASDDASVLPLPDFEGVYTLAALDIDNDRVATRSIGGGSETLKLRRLSDYKSSVDQVLATVGPYPYGQLGAYQGHATIDGDVYVSRGNAAGGNDYDLPTITRYSWTEGTSTRIDVSQVGSYGDGRAGDHNEVESCTLYRNTSGKPSLLFSKVTGGTGSRRNNIYAYSPVGSDDLAASTLQTVATRSQSGYVYVYPEPNKPSFTHVEFPWEFPVPPIVQVTAVTSVPGAFVTGVAASGTTTDGVDIYLTRTNDTRTGVYWTATMPTIPTTG